MEMRTINTVGIGTTTVPGGGGITTTSPGGGGDPMVFDIFGNVFEVQGTVGQSYNYLTDGVVSVVVRVGAIPNSTKTRWDQVTVKVPGHTLIVGLTTATLDGAALSHYMPAKPIPYTNGYAEYWTGPANEIRVDIYYGSLYWISVIQDNGYNTYNGVPLHPSTSPLHGVPNLGFWCNKFVTIGMSSVYLDPIANGLSGLGITGLTTPLVNFVVSIL